MGLPDSAEQSFIVRLWLERRKAKAGQALWRGRIVHVPSGESRTFDDLSVVVEFIEDYLTRVGLPWRSGSRPPDDG